MIADLRAREDMDGSLVVSVVRYINWARRQRECEDRKRGALGEGRKARGKQWRIYLGNDSKIPYKMAMVDKDKGSKRRKKRTDRTDLPHITTP